MHRQSILRVSALVLLMLLQVGCQAPAPRSDPYQELRRYGDTMLRDMDRENAEARQSQCQMFALVAVVRATNRDKLSLDEWLAQLDRSDPKLSHDPQALEYFAMLQQVILTAAANPQWTPQDVERYGQQVCLRWREESSPVAQARAVCRFQGRIAEGLVRARDIERMPRDTILARYDRALGDPTLTEEARQTIAANRRLVVQVYAQPTWTSEQFRVYVEQECLRTNAR